MDADFHKQLQLEFVAETAAQMPRMEAQLQLLRTDPFHAEATEALRLFFHRVAGTAASVELADLGRVAGICERVVTIAQRGDDALRPHLRAILSDGHRVIASLLQSVAP